MHPHLCTRTPPAPLKMAPLRLPHVTAGTLRAADTLEEADLIEEEDMQPESAVPSLSPGSLLEQPNLWNNGGQQMALWGPPSGIAGHQMVLWEPTS